MTFFKHSFVIRFKSIIVLLLISITAVAVSGCTKTDKGEEAAADIEAAMMQGREAAKLFVSRPWKDTAELRHKLIEVRVRKIRYDSLGKIECGNAYDSAFVSTIRTIRPDIAEKLE